MNDAIRAAFEAGKAAERFYDRSGLSNRGRTPEGSTNTAGHGQKPDWHH